VDGLAVAVCDDRGARRIEDNDGDHVITSDRHCIAVNETGNIDLAEV
jgi:hypothetical protein